MNRLSLLILGLLCSLVGAQAVTVSFGSTNKPSSWPGLLVTANGSSVASGSDVAAGSNVVFTAPIGVGYHVEWYVNSEKSAVKGPELALTVEDNTTVEARYVEHFKFIFSGTPFVKYANERGVVWLTQNFYHHDYYVQDNFAHTVSQWTGDDNKTYQVDNLPLDTTVVTRVT